MLPRIFSLVKLIIFNFMFYKIDCSSVKATYKLNK